MTPKLWNVALIAGGLLLICAGMQQWRTNQLPAKTVTAFLQAVKDNDHAAALQLMTPDLREQVLGVADDYTSAWTAPTLEDAGPDRITFEIESLHVRGNTATAKALFRHAGLPFVNSQVELQRSATGLWQVARIDNRVNHAWKMLQNEQLSIELRNALKDFPGAQVAEEPSPQRR